MLGHGADAQKIRLALETSRKDIVAAVHSWRAQGGTDDELALVVDGRSGSPRVSTTTRRQLELTIGDFEPTMAIEFARNAPGQAPAIVDLPDLVRRVVWIDLTPPFTW